MTTTLAVITPTEWPGRVMVDLGEVPAQGEVCANPTCHLPAMWGLYWVGWDGEKDYDPFCCECGPEQAWELAHGRANTVDHDIEREIIVPRSGVRITLAAVA